jgi:hypothetical protein
LSIREYAGSRGNERRNKMTISVMIAVIFIIAIAVGVGIASQQDE